MSEKENLREWIHRRLVEEQTKIDALPPDSTPECLQQYQESSKKLLELGRMKALHFPPKKAESNPELEEILYD